MRFVHLVIILTSLVASACSGYPQNQNSDLGRSIEDVVVHAFWSVDVSTKAPRPGTGGARGIGLVMPQFRNVDDRPQTVEFRLAADDTFRPYLILLNGANYSKTYIVTTILDYRQVRFELDGRSGLLHEVVVPPQTQLEIPFELKIADPGAHDVQTVAFDDPYNETLDLGYRSNLYGYVAARRAVVIVDEDESRVRALDGVKLGTPIPPDVSFAPLVDFAVAPTEETRDIHPSRRQLYVDSVRAGEPYGFEVLLNNTMDLPATYALISFLDYHQVQIGGGDVMLARLEPRQQAVFEAQVNMPKDNGIRQFQVIYLFDPYGSVLRGEVAAPYVFGSPRIAFESR